MIKTIYCGNCGKILGRVSDDTEGNIYLWCKRCKKEIKVDLKKIKYIKEP